LQTVEALVTPVTLCAESGITKNERLRSTQPLISLFPILKQAKSFAVFLTATTFALQPAPESKVGA